MWKEVNKKILKIKSQDHTDTIIFIDKIQYVLEKKNGCTIAFDNGTFINSSAKIEDIEKAINELI